MFRAQQLVLEAQKRAQEALVHIRHLEGLKAAQFIKKRQKHKEAIERLLVAVYQRYQNIQKRLASLKTAGLHRKLSQAERQHAVAVAHQQEVKDATAHRTALREAIASEKKLNPWEQNPVLLSAWQAEERHLADIVASVPPSTAAISNAQEALQRNTLQNELKPLGERLHALGGSSTSIGTGGEIGILTKQIKTLHSGLTALETRTRNPGRARSRNSN